MTVRINAAMYMDMYISFVCCIILRWCNGSDMAMVLGSNDTIVCKLDNIVGLICAVVFVVVPSAFVVVIHDWMYCWQTNNFECNVCNPTTFSCINDAMVDMVGSCISRNKCSTPTSSASTAPNVVGTCTKIRSMVRWGRWWILLLLLFVEVVVVLNGLICSVTVYEVTGKSDRSGRTSMMEKMAGYLGNDDDVADDWTDPLPRLLGCCPEVYRSTMS